MEYYLVNHNGVTIKKFNSEQEGIDGFEKYLGVCMENYGKKIPCRLFYNFSHPMVYIREYK